MCAAAIAAADLASISTIYRVLAENKQVKEHRRLALHPARAIPELVATAPGRVCHETARLDQGQYLDIEAPVMIEPMDGSERLNQLAHVIDEHRWGELSGLLHQDFSCLYVHTGERFDRDTWVRLNAEYPGFQRFVLEDCVGQAERAAGRAHVTAESEGQLQHFQVATFISVRNDLISDMTEVWTGVDEAPAVGARPM